MYSTSDIAQLDVQISTNGIWPLIENCVMTNVYQIDKHQERERERGRERGGGENERDIRDVHIHVCTPVNKTTLRSYNAILIQLYLFQYSYINHLIIYSVTSMCLYRTLILLRIPPIAWRSVINWKVS